MITLTRYKIKHKIRLPSLRYFTTIAEATLAACQHRKDYHVSLAFVDDGEIAALNEHWLQRQGPTDVLSFEGEGDFLGEVIINLDMLERMCTERNMSVRDMVTRYTVHGILSLLGLDHKEGDRAVEIQALEDTIVQSVV